MSENPYDSPENVSETPSPKKRTHPWVTLLTVTGVICVLVALLLPAQRSSRGAPRSVQCSNNIRAIAMALLEYEAVHGALPPAYTVDADGKPLHSWRTLILPHVGRKPLYDSIDLSKPWDDPVNAAAFNTPIGIYCCPSAGCPENHTTYLASVGPSGGFVPTTSVRVPKPTDNPGMTPMVIEVAPGQSVPWMCPTDADESLMAALRNTAESSHDNGTHAAMHDGTVHFLAPQAPVDDRRAISLRRDPEPSHR